MRMVTATKKYYYDEVKLPFCLGDTKMSRLQEALNDTAETLNGAVTNYSSLDANLDLFYLIGAARNMDILPVFSKAYTENKELALRIALWARDIRGGAGERQTFRDIIGFLRATPLFDGNHPSQKMYYNFIDKVAEVGRWDDYLAFIDVGDAVGLKSQWERHAMQKIAEAIGGGNALCAKWMPRKGSFAAKIRREMLLTPKEWRQTIVRLSDTVEQKMCANQWDKIEYGKLPSMAAKNYMTTFHRHDGTRYQKYIDGLADGTEKINAGAIFPHDVIKGLFSDKRVAQAQWEALPNYLEGVTGNIIPLVDVSGSMHTNIGGNTSAIDVALALGLYLSERLTGVFQDEFITFSKTPVLQKVKGTLADRYMQMHSSQWDMNTNFQAVFDLILQQGIKHELTQEDMLSTILVLSDMEFDAAGPETNFNTIRAKYALFGYKMPTLVFWNLNGRMGNVPARSDDENVALVSGFSPALMKDVLKQEIKTPLETMMAVVGNSRYDI